MTSVKTVLASFSESIIQNPEIVPLKETDEFIYPSHRLREGKFDLEYVHSLLCEAASFPFRLRIQDTLEREYTSALKLFFSLNDFLEKCALSRCRRPGK
jgi:hypothetical protein